MASVVELLQAAREQHRRGQWPQADALYQQVLDVEPRQVEALRMRGLIAHKLGRPELALRYLRQSLEVDPAQAMVYNILGEVFRGNRQFDVAQKCYDEALRLQPSLAAAHYNLGLMCEMQQRFEDAERAYQAAIRCEPRYAEAYNNLGGVLRRQSRGAEALAAYQGALRCKPDYAEAVNNVAAVLADAKRYTEAVQLLRHSLEIEPERAEVYYNLANTFRLLKRWDEAETCYRDALRLRPDYPEALFNLGLLHTLLGRDEEAISQFEAVIQTASLATRAPHGPLAIRAHTNRGKLLLRQGRFAEGWPEYEWRAILSGVPSGAAHVWSGERLDGQSILVQGEADLSDALLLVRYVRMLEARGARVVLQVPGAWVPLLSSAGFAEVVPVGQAARHDCARQVPIVSLPRILESHIDSAGALVPYLAVNDERAEALRGRLAEIEGFRIGICWHDGAQSEYDGRAIRLLDLEPLARVPGVRLISLQTGEGHEQIEEARKRFEIVDLGGELDAAGGLVNSAAIMRGLDLVVSIDAPLAHLAGAMGVPLWVALPVAPSWSWLTERPDSPWYPQARLFRQRQLDDWEGVVADLAASLAQRVQEAAHDKRG